jgi:hypothetical protein
LGKFGKVLQGKTFVFFVAILSILWPNGLFYDNLVRFVVICYILSRFGMLYIEKSGNPGCRDEVVGRGRKRRKEWFDIFLWGKKIACFAS